jgi:acyl-CoA thioesterase II
VSHDRHPAEALHGSLDELLRVLELEPAGADRFRVPASSQRLFDHIYGGQLLAQALVGAGATVDGMDVQSLHAAFVRGGSPGDPVEVAVTRVRDGRSMTTRQVAVLQDGEPLLVAFVSFHRNTTTPQVAAPRPDVRPPDQTPLLQEWAQKAGESGRHWIERPPPVELRLPEALSFLGGTGTSPTRSHWMRAPLPVDGGPVLHAALLAYASDFFLMDMVFRLHPAEVGPGRVAGLSVDHAIWFHQPSRFDLWHLHTQEAVAIVGERGLARGMIHDFGGRLVATVMQEVLVRPVPAR